MLRQLVIVAVLFGIMTWLPQLVGSYEGAVNPASMAAFGFIVLAAYTLGELAERVRLPHITGYLVTGLVCGPHILGLVDQIVVRDLGLFNVLAVALIGLSAGGALEIRALQKGFKVITGVIAAQFLAVMLGVGLLVMLMALPIPGIGLAFLQEGGILRALAVALLLGTVAAAFSPAATIAVIHGVRARGEVTDKVLGISILNNVVVVAVFAATLAISQRLVGADHGDTRLIVELLITLGGSIGMGLLLGLVLWAYLRFVGTHLLLLLVGLCFVVTHLAEQLGTEPVLVFIVAGFTFANASPRSKALFAVVDRLSLPIYVVFFFIAGAGLHLDALAVLWPAALLVFGGRLVSLWLGTRLGTRLTKGPDGLSRYGWMTFGPQAGIALSLAMVAGHAFEGWGATFETLAVATIGLNELVGPALLQAALGLVGEAKAERQGVDPKEPAPQEPTAPERAQPGGASDTREDRDAEARLPEWLPEPGRPRRNVWGPPPATRSERLRSLCRGLEIDLQSVVRDLRAGAISRRREQAVRFLGLLRREFLRAHRHTTLTVNADDPQAWRLSIRHERGELASRWEQLLLDRAATTDFRQDLRTFQAIVEQVDRSTEDIPEALEVPLDPAWADAREDDSLRLAGNRWWVRTRRRLLEATGAPSEEQRAVELRAITRYCLSGLAPTHLIEAAALIAMGERHLLARARSVFEAYHQALESLLDKEHDVEERKLALELIRTEVEEDFALAGREVDRMADDTVRVTASALGRAFRELVRMVDCAGTAELPPSRYRFSRIYDARERALRQLEEGFSVSRELTRGIASNLAMELEMVRLRVHVREAVEQAADGLERDVRGRLLVQLERLDGGLTSAIAGLRTLLSGSTPEREAIRLGIQSSTAPLAHLLHEVLTIAEKLRASLKNEAAVGPLLRSLSAEIDELTDRFLVVTDAPATRGRSFPARPQTRDLHFREAVRAYMEAEAGRDLTVSLGELRVRIDETFVGIDEVQRVLAFNSDLAGAELDVLPDDHLEPETLELLREMLVGTLQRVSNRVTTMSQDAADLPEQAGQAVRGAVTGNLERLTSILVDGRHGELKLRLALETASAGRRELHGALREVAQAMEQLGQVLTVALGPRSLAKARTLLGLRDPDADSGRRPVTFAPPVEKVPIPTVYRRLFSDQGLEGGDLLAGRDADVERVRRTLTGRGKASRTVAVVGVAGIGNAAVINTLLRGLPEQVRIHRIRLDACTSAEQVEERILAPMRASRGDIAVVEGFHWLFSIRPGGFAPLRALVDGVIEDRGRNGWLISTERPVWSYTKRVLPLEDIFCERFDLGALSVEELRNTLLLRHTMSGYRLHFQRPPGHIGWWFQELITRKSAEEELHERHFFERLHQATGGILSDALRLWLASVDGVGSSTDTITIGALPEPPLEPLRKLPLDDLITLRQLARQGRITAEDHAQQFRTEPTWSAGLLTRLEHSGLLQRVDECCYRLAPELAGAIHQVLRERKLLG
jgi:Kef-type K+ transport system membrane component KefB